MRFVFKVVCLWVVTLCFGSSHMIGCAFSHESFFTLMGEPKTQLSAQDKNELRELSNDYDAQINILSQPPINRIPHTIHVIWLGPKDFPERSIPNMLSWKRNHPEWQFFFWTDSKTRPLPVPGMTRRLVQEYDFGVLGPYIALSTNWGEKADMMRYTILFKEGGVYADHDVYCERSVGPLVDHFDFVAGCDPSQPHPGIESNVIVNNSTILSRPQHPILGSAIEQIVRGWHTALEKCPGSDGMSELERVARRTLAPFIEAAKGCRCLGHNKDIILPSSFFYSHGLFLPGMIERLKSEGYVYVIHKHS